MSIKLMSKVWGREVKGTEREILLVMTDHADDFGDNARPSIGYIAWKVGCDERTVIRHIKALRQKKALILTRRSAIHAPNIYRVQLDVYPNKKPFVPKGDERGDKMSPDKMSPDTALSGDKMTERGDKMTERGDTALSPDPPYEPPYEPSVNAETAEIAETHCSQSPALPEQSSIIEAQISTPSADELFDQLESASGAVGAIEPRADPPNGKAGKQRIAETLQKLGENGLGRAGVADPRAERKAFVAKAAALIAALCELDVTPNCIKQAGELFDRHYRYRGLKVVVPREQVLAKLEWLARNRTRPYDPYQIPGALEDMFNRENAPTPPKPKPKPIVVDVDPSELLEL